MKTILRSRSRPNSTGGFLLVELMCAMVILLIGLMSLGLVMVSVSRQQEHARARRLVLAEAQSIFEEMRGVAPESIASAYQGRTYLVPGVTGNSPDGSVITAAVDQSNPRFLKVNLSAGWNVVGQVSSLTLEFELYASTANVNCN